MGKDTGRAGEAVDRAAAAVSPEDAVHKAVLLRAWQNALDQLKKENKGPGVLSSSENALASRLQSYLAEKAIAEGARTVLLPDGSREVKFDNLDIFPWIGTGLQGLFHVEPHPFVPPDPVATPIADDAHVALFSDWGTGLYGAPAIRDSIARDRQPFHIVMHLGDTYYSGSRNEIRQRLIDMWPRRTASLNVALNGNHEMYSGGWAYFDAALRFCRQHSSCAAFQNSNWLLACLDTAWTEHDIDEDKTRQLFWLKTLIANAGARKVILFSHHQPYSQLDGQGPHLQTALKDILESGRVSAWYFGHEHRCVLYNPHSRWGLKARCVGHGGFPAFRDKFGAPRSSGYEWRFLPATDQAPAAQVLDGPNPYVESPLFEYSPHGYATLQFNGVACLETYLLPDATVVSGPSAI